MTVWGERIAAVLSSLGAVYMAYAAWNFPAAGNQFPVFAAAAIVVISMLMVIRTVISPDVFTGRFRWSPWREQAKPLLLTAAAVAYVLIIFELGYYTSTLLFLVCMAYAVGVRDLRMIGLTALITLPLMYAFFELFLEAQMPRGLLI